jgi:ankyrin repeat protein
MNLPDDLNSQKNLDRALVKYSQSGNLEIVKYLVEHGADVHAGDDEALHLSSNNGHLEIVEYLVEHGADINVALFASSEHGHLHIVKYLVEHGADVHAGDDEALHLSSNNGHLEIVEYLVEHGADIHADYDAALIFSSRYGHLEVVKFLVEHGADIHTNDNYALRMSSEKGHLEVVKYLVEHGADVHADNDYALRWSSHKGYLETVKYLVEHGADIHYDNDSALQMSSKYGNLEVVKFLVENGADISQVDLDTIPDDIREFFDSLNNKRKLYQNLESKCNANSLTNGDIKELRLKFGIQDANVSNICKKISDIFEKKSQEIKNSKCITEETLIGTSLYNLHPMLFYSFTEDNKLYCGDIREFKKLDRNPWTRKPFDSNTKMDIKNQYRQLEILFKDTTDQDNITETIAMSIQTTLTRAMSNVLRELRYPNNVIYYINANDTEINLFINDLKMETILSQNELNNLNHIKELNNKKLALANTLNLKLNNDITTEHNLSSLRVYLEEIYNKYFHNE